MPWKPINESPDGFEPVYTVIETETGREIAKNLEYFEAYQVSNAQEMYNIICNSVKSMEELYIHYSKNDTKFLQNVNEIITNMYKILDEIPKEVKI